MFPDGLLTPRLQLRPIAPRDARPIFHGYAQDREVTRFLTWRPHTTLSQTEAYVADCMAATSSRTYVLVERASERVIGAFAVRRTNGHAFDVGYVLERPSWGRGLMTEALTEVTRWALSQKGIWRLWTVCDVENVGSSRVMEKAGLSREGVLRRWIIHPNTSDEPRDCLVMAKVLSDGRKY